MTRLRVTAFPGWAVAGDLGWHAATQRWLARAPLAAEMHRWVAEADGEVVGYLGALPQYYRIRGRRVVAHTPADFMVLPGYGIHAVSLMRRFFRTCENYVACDAEPKAMAIEMGLGAERSGDLHHHIKIIDIAHLPDAPANVSRGVLAIAGWGVSAVDRVLLHASANTVRVAEVDSFDQSFDGFHERVAAGVACTAQKDSAFLRWRYGAGSPHAPVTVLVAKRGGSLLGYTVLRVTPSRDGYLLDLTTLPGRNDVSRALLRAVIEHSRQAGVQVLRYRFVPSATAPSPRTLRRLGFLDRHATRYIPPPLRTDRRHTLLVRFQDRGLQEVARDLGNWSYSVGDGEASYGIG